MELAVASDVQELCRKAVELGRTVLDFDRIGIWFINRDDPAWEVGTWGTDENGELRDERNSRVRRDPTVTPEEFYHGNLPILDLPDSIVFNHDHEPVGRADRLLAPLWDGRLIIGELAVDNLLTRRPFDEERREIVVVFARVIAHLTSLKRVESELRLLASTDSLTGSINRRTALIILEKQIGSCLRNGSPLTISIIDLDGLKLANDRHGHAEGDEYIRDVFRSLVKRVRVSDTVGRLGGDEFIIVFPDCVMGEAERIVDDVAGAVAASSRDRSYRRSISCGLASLSEISPDAETEVGDIRHFVDVLMDLADKRMYMAKRRKRNERT
ncbi:MAG TPA: diguanylate cyclase [Spirochaetia bacterium]|nr:diguanylate cyclase [Spirochaetia bacterium]